MTGWLAGKPDLFLGEIVSRLATQGVERSATSVARLITRHGITQKKTVIAADQTRADIARARDEWRERMSALDPSKRVFVDESGFDTKLTRRFGRAARGVPCVGAVPHGHWRNTTFIAGLRNDRIDARC